MNEKSAQALAAAQAVLPGGVDSPVRAFRAVGGEPPVIASAAGSRLTDVDGNTYVDYVTHPRPRPRRRDQRN